MQGVCDDAFLITGFKNKHLTKKSYDDHSTDDKQFNLDVSSHDCKQLLFVLVMAVQSRVKKMRTLYTHFGRTRSQRTTETI